MKINDRFVILYIGIGFPIFIVSVTSILLSSAVFDKISFDEAFDSLQGIIPVFITYVGAILGFSFRIKPEISHNFLTQSDTQDDDQSIIRVYVSLILTNAIMVLQIFLTVAFVLGKIDFKNYKIGTFATTWTLTGAIGFIVGKYFGDSDKNYNLQKEIT